LCGAAVAAIGVAAGAASSVRADDAASAANAASETGATNAARATSLHMRGEALREQDGPLLHLDTALGVNAEGIGADEQQQTYAIELGRLRVVAGGRWWQAGMSPALPGPAGSHDLDVVARGWRLAGELSYDLGPVRLGATYATSRVDSRSESGSYTDVAVSVSRAFRLSRGILGWISLGAGLRRWAGRPPPGEANGANVLLSVGGNWK
jgi:hypothetical protein